MIAGYRISDQSSNPGLGCWRFTSHKYIGEMHESLSSLPLAMSKYSKLDSLVLVMQPIQEKESSGVSFIIQSTQKLL